jgi:hypothetical protein
VDGIGGLQQLTAGNMETASVWHPDGRTLVFQGFSGSFSNLMRMQLGGDENAGWKPGTPTAVFETPYQEESPALSPDGKWIAYGANDTGTREVYVRPFPGPGGATLVSSGGGADPVWSPTRSELFYQTLRTGMDAAQIMVAPFAVTDGQLRIQRPRRWGTVGLPATIGKNFAIHPDGKRFVIPAVTQPAGGARSERLVVVLNLFDELRRLAK